MILKARSLQVLQVSGGWMALQVVMVMDKKQPLVGRYRLERNRLAI